MLKQKIIYIGLLILLLTVGLSGCRDEALWHDEEYGEGSASLSASVIFSPVLNALEGTRADGNAIKHINSLCVIIYDENGELYRRVPQDELENLTITDNDKVSPSDALPGGSHQAEMNTPEATFTIKNVPFGKYKIYAVANMGDLNEDPYNYDDEDIKTPELLQSIQLKWNENNIGSNDQMFGYFTPADDMSSSGYDAPVVTVGKIITEVHAWIKRAASKVTVAVDGSGLKDGVTVWIKSIQIRDIPRYCYLGRNNEAASHNLIKEGEKTTFSSQQGVGTGEEVSKTQNWPLNMADAHTETANAYYFYENMQGTGQLKAQVWPDQGENPTLPKYPDGNSPVSDGYKDKMLAGTYIEVIGYYKSTNPEREGEGTIIYRFSLGKDTEYNYDAQRNYHYKLTLKLRNFANENDWHIVYDPEPDILTPNPYYISYLYNEGMSYPFKITGYQLVSLQAEIEDDDINKKSWEPYDCKETGIYWTGAVDKPGPWNGFLRLNKSKVSEYGTVAQNFGSGNAATYTNNKTEWEKLNMGKRSYPVENGVYEAPFEGRYEIHGNGAGEWEVTIPFFTNARVMTEQTGYTGNNPFIAYMREAQVTITAEIKDSKGQLHTISKKVQIRQSRRIVNPTGIWREADNTKSFHVQLKILEREDSEEFVNLHSDGPWMAVIKNGDWFDLIPTEGVSKKNPDGTISGIGNPYDVNNPGTVIDFTFKPKGKASSPRGGIIKVYYNNYSCVHLIYVRQGYDPVSFDGNTYWHSYNMLTEDSEVSDPAAEGSYFRQYNVGLPISASNNTLAMFDQNAAPPHTFAIQGTTQNLEWPYISTQNTEWPVTFRVNGKDCRLPSVDDMNPIIGNPSVIYGFGVLYTGKTEETAVIKSDVYGAREGATQNRGMRGVFICDTISGTQIFLPVSASGYGRFKQKANGSDYRQRDGWMGVIQYANRWTWFPTDITYNVSYKPLFWDLFRSQGAEYWLGTPNSIHGGYAVDINYYTLNFRYSDLEDLGIWWPSNTNPDPSGTDAILMRLVQDGS